MYYEPWELQSFENIECEWPLFFTFLILDGLFNGNKEQVCKGTFCGYRLPIKIIITIIIVIVITILYCIVSQRRPSGLKSGGRGSGSTKFRFFQANFREISIFSGNSPPKSIFFQENFRKIFIFRQISETF